MYALAGTDVPELRGRVLRDDKCRADADELLGHHPVRRPAVPALRILPRCGDLDSVRRRLPGLAVPCVPGLAAGPSARLLAAVRYLLAVRPHRRGDGGVLMVAVDLCFELAAPIPFAAQLFACTPQLASHRRYRIQRVVKASFRAQRPFLQGPHLTLARL